MIPSQIDPLKTQQIDLKGCIPLYQKQQFVIKTREDYLKQIRNDMSRERCLKESPAIDFSQNTLLGIEINSGYCRYPAGLTYQTVKDADKKQYLLKISYLDPHGSVCRALSQYELWVLVPKLPENYEVAFEVKAR